MFQAFELGPFIFWTRLVAVLIGLWLSTEFFLRIAHTANLSLQHFRQHGLWYILAFLIGGRWFSVMTQFKVYIKDPLRILIATDGGFSFLGGAIGIGMVLYFATRGHRSTFLQWLDALFPATTLGLVFEWLGAFFAGSAYGHPTDVFWGVIYDAMNVRYSVPIHPVQLYYAIFYFFLTFLLLVIRKHSKRVGAETLVGIVCATMATFFFEYFRGDFSIPVFATKIDFILLLSLFASLGILATIEAHLSSFTSFVYELFLVLIAGGYLILRPFLDLETYELRFSQLLAVLALLATVVYVVNQRRRYPYL